MSELEKHYGDRRHRPVGRATIQAVISDDQEAIFTPCRYRLAEVSFQEGEAVAGLDEIVSHRGRFSEQARRGERVRARGSLEEVTPANGPAHYQLAVGGQPGDYMLADR